MEASEDLCAGKEHDFTHFLNKTIWVLWWQQMTRNKSKKKRRPEKGFLNNPGKNDVGLDQVVEDKGWKEGQDSRCILKVEAMRQMYRFCGKGGQE